MSLEGFSEWVLGTYGDNDEEKVEESRSALGGKQQENDERGNIFRDDAHGIPMRINGRRHIFWVWSCFLAFVRVVEAQCSQKSP